METPVQRHRMNILNTPFLKAYGIEQNVLVPWRGVRMNSVFVESLRDD